MLRLWHVVRGVGIFIVMIGLGVAVAGVYLTYRADWLGAKEDALIDSAVRGNARTAASISDAVSAAASHPIVAVTSAATLYFLGGDPVPFVLDSEAETEAVRQYCFSVLQANARVASFAIATSRALVGYARGSSGSVLVWRVVNDTSYYIPAQPDGSPDPSATPLTSPLDIAATDWFRIAVARGVTVGGASALTNPWTGPYNMPDGRWGYMTSRALSARASSLVSVAGMATADSLEPLVTAANVDLGFEATAAGNNTRSVVFLAALTRNANSSVLGYSMELLAAPGCCSRSGMLATLPTGVNEYDARAIAAVAGTVVVPPYGSSTRLTDIVFPTAALSAGTAYRPGAQSVQTSIVVSQRIHPGTHLDWILVLATPANTESRDIWNYLPVILSAGGLALAAAVLLFAPLMCCVFELTRRVQGAPKDSNASAKQQQAPGAAARRRAAPAAQLASNNKYISDGAESDDDELHHAAGRRVVRVSHRPVEVSHREPHGAVLHTRPSDFLPYSENQSQRRGSPPFRNHAQDGHGRGSDLNAYASSQPNKSLPPQLYVPPSSSEAHAARITAEAANRVGYSVGSSAANYATAPSHQSVEAPPPRSPRAAPAGAYDERRYNGGSRSASPYASVGRVPSPRATRDPPPRASLPRGPESPWQRDMQLYASIQQQAGRGY